MPLTFCVRRLIFIILGDFYGFFYAIGFDYGWEIIIYCSEWIFYPSEASSKTGLSAPTTKYFPPDSALQSNKVALGHSPVSLEADH